MNIEKKSDEEEPVHEQPHHAGPIATSTGQIILGPDNYIYKPEKREEHKKKRKVTYWE